MQSSMFNRHFASKLGGIFFFLTAIAQIVANFGPPLAGEIEFLDRVIEQPGSTLFFTYMIVAVMIFNVPALVGTIHVVNGRGRWLTYIGAMVALIGNFFFVVLVTEALFARGMAILDREQMILLLEWSWETPVYILPHLITFLLFEIGILLLAIGLFRARLASFWLIVAGMAHIIFGMLDLGAIQVYLQSVIAAALFGGIGWILLFNRKSPSVTTSENDELSIDK